MTLLWHYIEKIGSIKGFIKQLTASEKDNLDNYKKKMKIKLKFEFFKGKELYKEMIASA